MVSAAKQQAAATVYMIVLLHTCRQTASAQPSLQSPDIQQPQPPGTSNASQLSPTKLAPFPNSGLTCELEVLNQLGWQHLYSLSGYSISASLPFNCSSHTWQSLGCLTALTNFTLTGSLPSLPNSWATNNSFSSLQALDLSQAQLNGTLPASWGSASCFPRLR